MVLSTPWRQSGVEGFCIAEMCELIYNKAEMAMVPVCICVDADHDFFHIKPSSGRRPHGAAGSKCLSKAMAPLICVFCSAAQALE